MPKRMSKTFGRYALMGMFSTVVNIAAFVFFTSFGLWYLVASIVAFSLRSLTRFTLLRYWVFKGETSRPHLFGWFVVQEIVGLILGTLVIAGFVEILGVPETLALVLTVCVLYLGGFLTARRIFAHDRQGD